MSFETIATVWASLTKDAKIIILTEPERWQLAEKIKRDNETFVSEIKLLIVENDDYESQINLLTEHDLVIVLLTIKGFMEKGYNRKFSPFSKPKGLKSKYIFIRLDIPENSLLSGLHTDMQKIDKIITEIKALCTGSQKVRVTTGKGMELTTRINYQETFSYHARDLGGHAFLPPSEIANELYEDATNGIIVVDCTVGEFRINGQLIDALGLVDEPVMIQVENGQVKSITGGKIAERLRKCFALLPSSQHVVVELGHGLSDMEPTGIIGVDESMNGTCHIGIGNREQYHLDLVIKDPKITALP